MKLVYIVAAVAGALATFGYVYAYVLNDLREDSLRLGGPPVATFDSVVFLDALGLSVLFTPIGACVAMGVAFVVHTAWKMSKRHFSKPRSI